MTLPDIAALKARAEDSVARAPTLPRRGEIEAAREVVCLCVQLASVEKLAG